MSVWSLREKRDRERQNTHTHTLTHTLGCPQCGSNQLYRDGLRHSDNGISVQRWLCRICGYRFSEKSSKDCLTSNSNGQVCVTWPGAKNLTSATEIKTVAGEREIGKTQQGTILEYAWKLKKRGLAESTIRNRTQSLQRLVDMNADLMNSDSVETVLATEPMTAANKSVYVASYRSFAKAFNITWVPVKANYEPKQPFVPLESEIDQLIAHCGPRLATYLQVLKDTGARAGEACKLQWTDLDEQNGTIRINNPEKGSRSRTIKVTPKTVAMLKALRKKYGNNIFNHDRNALADSFRRKRIQLSQKLQNPRFMQIHFHSLRHWKATMEYSRTKDILYVKQILGHRRLENTEIYTHLIEFKNEEYCTAHAKTLEEEDKLLEAGFDYVRYSDKDQIAIYRKRK